MIVAGSLLVFLAVASEARAGVSMTTAPTATVSGWTLAPTGANTTSGGTVTLDATGPYTVTVAADVPRMSEYANGAYVSGGKTLGSALGAEASRTGGTATVPGLGLTVAISTSAGTLVTGTGIGTDTFSITLSQPTAITDAALAEGNTYHIVLTYTATATV